MAVKKNKKNGKDKNGYREEIINAAFELMLEKGYEDTGIQDILSKIGATKGCIYYYFKSKKRNSCCRFSYFF